MASSTPTIPRVFADGGDCFVRHTTQSKAHVYLEDSRPNDTSALIAICLPGIGDTRRQFRLLAPLLHQRLGCRVLLGDLRGFGDSTDFSDDTHAAYSPEGVASDVIKLMDEIIAKNAAAKFLLLGNSLAAGSMVIAALQHHAHTSGLVLLGPILRDTPMDWWFRPLSHLLFTSLYGRAVWMPYYKSLYPGSKPSDFDQELEVLSNHLRQNARNMTNVGKFVRATKAQATDALKKLGKIEPLPVKIVAVLGRKDPDYVNFDEELKWLQTTVPTAECIVFEDGGHYPHLEDPNQIIDTLVKQFGA